MDITLALLEKILVHLAFLKQIGVACIKVRACTVGQKPVKVEEYLAKRHRTIWPKMETPFWVLNPIIFNHLFICFLFNMKGVKTHPLHFFYAPYLAQIP